MFDGMFVPGTEGAVKFIDQLSAALIDRRGAAMVEYALLAALVALAAVFAISQVSTNIQQTFNALSTAL